MGFYKNSGEVGEFVEFPLRESGDKKRFFLWLIFFPIFVTVLTGTLISYICYPHAPLRILFYAAVFHVIILLLFLFLLWLPAILAYKPWRKSVEIGILLLRSIFLIAVFVLFFPHKYFIQFVLGVKEISHNYWIVYWLVFFVLSFTVLFFSQLNIKRGAFSNVRAGGKPMVGPYLLRWKVADIFTHLLFFVMIFVVEFRIVVITHEYQWFLFGKESTIEALMIKHEFRQILVVLCGTFFVSLVMFILGVIPNRVMNSVLITATFRERDVYGLFWKSYRYVRHFAAAVIYKSPLLPLLLISTFVLLASPVFLYFFNHYDLLPKLLNTDVVILFLGITSAWMGVLLFAVVHPDELYGEYFNQALSRLLLRIQDHKIYIGYGSLGQRIVKRHLNAQRISKKRKKYFFHIVTPDIQIESVSSRVVIVEKSLKNVVFSSQNDLIGNYGVVSACEERILTTDPNSNMVRSMKRILVPVIIGDASDAFSVARANLERAKQIICAVPDEDVVQAVFQYAVQYDIPAILTLPRSDLLSYFIYQVRNKKITLLYPEFDSGISIGYRVYATMRKLYSLNKELSILNDKKKSKSLLGKKGDVDSYEGLPKVMMIGNNRINQYMLESIWMNIRIFLKDDINSAKKYFEQEFSFVLISENKKDFYPTLKSERRNGFEYFIPVTLVTGSRYPYPIESKSGNRTEKKPFEINIPASVINSRDVIALEKYIDSFVPDVLVVSHFDTENTLLLLARCVRSLERIKTRKVKDFNLPMILLTSSRGSDWELVSLGDASRYYHAICLMFNEVVMKDTSYPIHSYFDHFKKQHVGESITDILVDTEEIISGSSASLDSDNFVEINACFPNMPGTLANFLAQLAGIDFRIFAHQVKFDDKEHLRRRKDRNPVYADIRRYWSIAEKNHTDSGKSIYLPSFQHLRNIMLDPDKQGFVLTGYAVLVETSEKDFYEKIEDERQLKQYVSRIHVMDGKTYVDRKPDEDHHLYKSNHSPDFEKIVSKYKEPDYPGVPDIIGRVTGIKEEKHNTIKEFYQSLTGNKDPNRQFNKFACPGIAGCRISAYQNWVIASNENRLKRYTSGQTISDDRAEDLLHARNYRCCPDYVTAQESDVPHVDSPLARIFFCCKAKYEPGHIAMVLNAVLFRLRYKQLFGNSDYHRKADSSQGKKIGRKLYCDWTINIDYFKDITCQNTYFSMNRIFGTIRKRGLTDRSSKIAFPAHVIRILPIGSMESMKAWFYYASALHEFLNEYDDDNEYDFYWVDEKRIKHYKKTLPTFTEKHDIREGVPNIIVIKKIEKSMRDKKCLEKDDTMCEYCGIQPREHDCSKFRVWI